MTTPSHPSLVYLRQPVIEHILPLFHVGLRAASDRHQLAEGHGVDNFSYGTDAWSLPARLLRDAAEAKTIPFALTTERGCVLSLDGHRIRHHRVAWSERDDIADSFPGGAKSLVAEVEEHQLSLPFGEEFAGIDAAVGGVVLAYMANPKTGFCAAYLAVVGRVDRGKIKEWAETTEIYARRQGPDASGPAAPSNVPPPEPIPTPLVHRKEKKASDAGST